MSVPTGGARPRITYITWRERSYPLGHEGDEESGEVHVWNHSMPLRYPALVIRLGSFSGYGRSLSDSLCFVVLFLLYILYFLFFSLGGDGPGVENKNLMARGVQLGSRNGYDDD
ncbi:hypothetical protein NW754_010103 [Fusarium falciforme]|uniref:Transmembrane protein n=1 Tax=Fusarium falciforme TaxID=195108 RepID=A0A9W8R8C9_9HYPO|nr:hypothetical protein NW754_010103 [Fusarium falciforme]KAJ4190873.1 hypothetical protein NW755_005084 [Fusarium falciforme]KAJ4202141.1 hypothetical protein NW767_006098 [Fusarium falciforme]